MPSDLQVSNIRDLNNANSAITIGSDGQIIVNQNNPTITLGSNTTLPDYSVVHAQTYELAGSSTATVTFGGGGQPSFNSYQDTGLEITISQANATKGSKILVFYSHGLGINAGTSSAQCHYRLRRTAPSSTDIHQAKYIGNQSTAVTTRVGVNGQGLDDRTADADYVYKLQCTMDSTSAGATVYINWYGGSLNTITALVLK